jgi:hypothetical protein
LTLWLLGVLVVAMAIATLIPQNAPPEAYMRALGEMLGPVVAKTALRNIYGSWWFIGAFALLGLNLLACVIQRSGQILRQEQQTPAQVTRQDTVARAHRGQWRAAAAVDKTAEALSASLRKWGYRVVATAGEEEGQRGLVARRGRLAPWVPIIVHVGVIIILVGAGWGKLPRNGYRETAQLQPGETFAVRAGDDAFSLRLVKAGEKRDAKGQPTDFWAEVEVLEDGNVVRSETIRPNHPLRYHSVSAVLQTMAAGAPAPPGLALEVIKGSSREQVPISITNDGAVDPMGSYRRLNNPHWMVVVTGLRIGDESGKGGPMASVMVDDAGPSPEGQMPSHEWREVGWVGENGVDFSGARLRLVHGAEAMQTSATRPTEVQLSLDRDIGLPIVYAGFIVIALGALLMLGNARSSLVALVAKKGQGSQVFVGASRSGKEMENLQQRLQSDIGATREGGPS